LQARPRHTLATAAARKGIASIAAKVGTYKAPNAECILRRSTFPNGRSQRVKAEVASSLPEIDYDI